jgi:hypothetical protein
MSRGDLGYFTIPVRDLQRGRTFYGGLFGWEFQAERATDPYAHIGNATPPGGLHVNDTASPQVWFKVDEITVAVATVRELGGRADEPQQAHRDGARRAAMIRVLASICGNRHRGTNGPSTHV